MPNFKKNPNPLKAKANLTADRQDTGGSRGGPFQMKYQGDHTAFPFKNSPTKTHRPGHEATGQHFDPTAGKPGKTKAPKGGDEYGGK